MTHDEKARTRFDVVLACRNAEIELFWKRSSFYWVFVAAALVAYGTLGKDNRTLGLLLSCFGLMSSLAWCLGNIGSKWWQENWEQKLKEISPYVIGADVFTPRRKEEMPSGNWSNPIIRYSVTRLAFLLSAFVAFIWFTVFVKEIFASIGNDLGIPSIGEITWLQAYKTGFVLVITVVFVILMFWRTRGEDREKGD